MPNNESGLNGSGRPSAVEIRRRINAIIFAQSFGAPLPHVLISGGVFSLLILQLGGSKFEIGLVFMLNFLAQSVRMFAARFADVHDTKRMYVLWCSIANFVFLPMFFVEPIRSNIGEAAAVWFACAVFFLQRTAINVGGTAWQPLVAGIIPPSLRGRFTGATRRAFQGVSLLVIIAAGYYLGEEPSIWRFYAVFGVVIGLSFIRPILLTRIPAPAIVAGTKPEAMSKNVARPFKDAHFRRFLLFWAYLVCVVNIARPFTVPFLKQDLGFPSSVTIYSSSLLVLGMAISLMRWGKLADRFGNRIVFFFNIVLMSVAFTALSFAPHYADSRIAAVAVSAASILLIGISVGGMGIAHTVRILHASPERYRGSYMSAFFIVNGIIAGLASTVAGLVLDALPAVIMIWGREILLMRLYFPCAAVLVLFSIPALRRIKPISEHSMRKTLTFFVESLPSVISVPLQAIRVVRNEPEDR